MKTFLYHTVLLFAIPTFLFAQKTQHKDFIILEEEVIKSIQPLMEAADLESVRMVAEKHLDSGPFSVIHKKQLPPSGDIHDYTSMGPYWWPDPEKSDGLPYIRRDREINPEYYDYKDKEDLGKLMVALTSLVEGYFFTGNEPFAAHAIHLIRTWFINSETKMNPNLNFAQRIPGRTEGRGIGIIDTRRFGELPDMLIMLSTSAHWTEQDDKAMKGWLTAYLDWLVNSSNGKDEAVHGNNHTTWYFAQTLPLAIYVGQLELADSLASVGIPLILDRMISSDGSQPLELARTKSWDYSAMNLMGMMTFAKACEHLGRNLWEYKNAEGVGIEEALAFLTPYATGKKPWEYDQISEFDATKLQTPLHIAALKYRDQSYRNIAKRLPAKRDGLYHWDFYSGN